MIVLVCGGREFNDYIKVSQAMRMLPFSVSMIIQGGARGADILGRQWAIENGIHYAEVHALWDSLGKKAGNLRNKAMLTLKPGYCVAFPGGWGTRDMIHKCIEANITVWEPYN